MKRLIPWIAILIGIIWIAGGLRPAAVPAGAPDLAEFGSLPVLSGGRFKPMDTIARTSLLIIHGKQSLRTGDGDRLTALRWLTDTLFDSAVSDTYPAFVINHPEVLGLFGWEQAETKYFSYRELSPFLRQIDEQGHQADDMDASQRSSYQTAILNLRKSLIFYQRLKNSLQPEGATGFEKELASYAGVIGSGREVVTASRAAQGGKSEELDAAARYFQRFDAPARAAYFSAVPPPSGKEADSEWVSTSADMLRALTGGKVSPVVTLYARIGDAYRAGDAPKFSSLSAELRNLLSVDAPRAVQRAQYEYHFNQFQPFYRSMGLYVLAGLLACSSWLGSSLPLRRSAFWLLVLALAVHTFGLVSRMYLQERPPVTNLYSSAVFIGWGAVAIGLVLERIYRDGIGSAAAGAVGFLTLIIAQHLAGSGDTLEMLQAVLDTNLWLATHVVVITAGYSTMFLAGVLAIFYVVRGVFTRSLTPLAAQSLARMTYGVICFAMLFSFVGTVLGGIWADQSWGRFWGWDPKENGALLIVLWCAIILHARWADMIRDRGFIVMVLFGNVITSFSWFGVNMLGVGLHSYGFMDKAFPWLVGFMVSQVVLMGIAWLPLEQWRSFRPSAAQPRRPAVRA